MFIIFLGLWIQELCLTAETLAQGSSTHRLERAARESPLDTVGGHQRLNGDQQTCTEFSSFVMPADKLDDRWTEHVGRLSVPLYKVIMGQIQTGYA